MDITGMDQTTLDLLKIIIPGSDTEVKRKLARMDFNAFKELIFKQDSNEVFQKALKEEWLSTLKARAKKRENTANLRRKNNNGANQN